MTHTDLAPFAAVFAVLFVAHQVADHWGQTCHQAAHKGLPGWIGRLACARHVGSYTLICAGFLVTLSAWTGWRPSPTHLVVGLTISAVTHYIADRRVPLRRLADWAGLGAFFSLGTPRPGRADNPSLGTGAYALDQSWHYAWLCLAALVISAA